MTLSNVAEHCYADGHLCQVLLAYKRFMLSFVMLNVIMLSVVAPAGQHKGLILTVLVSRSQGKDMVFVVFSKTIVVLLSPLQTSSWYS